MPGENAEEELVKRYLPLVKTVVGKISMTLPAHVDPDDLYSAGLMGLLNAVRNYKPDIGSPFEAYARLRIRGEVLDELRRMDWVPRSVHLKARKIQAAMEKLSQESGGAIAEDEEMAAELGLAVPEYRRWLEDVRPTTFVSLDTISGPDSEDEGAERNVVADPNVPHAAETASQKELSVLIAERIEALPPLYKKILALYYFEDLRVKEIAAICGFSESHICQVHAKAILAIKSQIEAAEASRLKPKATLLR